MEISVERLPECRALLRVEAPSDDVTEERRQVVRLYSTKAKIPGFRAGKVPAKVIEKRFKNEIESELEERFVKKALQKVTEDEKLDILRVVEVRDQSLSEDGPFLFTTEIVTAPDFELPEYKGIEVQVPNIEVTEEQLEEALDQIRERFADYEDIEDRPAQMGDFAVIDYKATVGGSPLGQVAPNAPATLAQNTGFWLRMAEDTFLPGFCAGVVGASVGDNKQIQVSIPDDFPDESVRGQLVDYDVEVKGLKTQVLPELDDEFASKVEAGKSLAEIKESLSGRMIESRKAQREEMIASQVLDKLAANLDFDLPREMVASETQSRIDSIVANNTERGIGEDEIMQHQDEIVQAAGQQATLSVRTSFILEQIADAEDIKVEKAELLARIAQLAQERGTPVKKLYRQIEKNNGFGRILSSIRLQKTLKWLRDNATVTEVDPPPAGA